MTIGQRIKLFRKERGFTQSELAEMIGVSMQAVSKWETDSGMPDISQIVPLAKVLGVTTDVLLGLDPDETDSALMNIREKIGYHNVNISEEEAHRIYEIASPFFFEHPTSAEAAFWCLESLAVLIPQRLENTDKQTLLKECRRYSNCISRNEISSDKLFKSYYVTSRCMRALGDNEAADEIMEKIPYVFGDRDYWEAEFAFADGDYETALQKCKRSFANKARYISRCIRMAKWISEKQGEPIESQVELNRYMLTMIDAFLSGGDYLPHRMVGQKIHLLWVLVDEYSRLGKATDAVDCMKNILDTRDLYYDFLKNLDGKHCLMFVEGDSDGEHLASGEQIDHIVESCMNCLSCIKELQGSDTLDELRKRC
ncbi:MAG: helix-turn-helix transcriptional regulator [Clostridia bacterium]|nr:helix-turn-helix transcriptional regulator [Clostridia bacterium]